MRFFLCFLCGWLLSAAARAEFIVPALTSPVEDAGDLINARDEVFLRNLILRFREKSGAQLQVLTVKTLGDIPIEQASIQVTDQWKLGDKKRDDGILLMVAAREHKIRIEVGQGFEGVLPDLKAKHIIEDVMVPVFRHSSPSQGIVVGVYQIIKAIDPQFSEGNATSPTSSLEEQQTVFQKYEGIFILFFVLLILFLNRLTPRGRRFGGGYWGGGGSGWGGGGGWSGGGGGFSGGGASGNW